MSEIYSVKVSSTRSEYDVFSFERTPEENALENDYYGTCFTVEVLAHGRECARLRGKLFDETLVYGSAQDLLTVADTYSRAENRLASCLNASGELQVREGEWQEWDKERKQPVHRGYSGYIQILFVEEPFRKRKIASYLLTNLHKILRHTLGIEIRAVAISPAPLTDADGTLLVDSDDAAEKLRAGNISLLTRCGYHEIMEESDDGIYSGNYDDFEMKGTGCWVRVYPAE